MNTKTIILTLGMSLILVTVSACGGAPATEAPAQHEESYSPAPAATEEPSYAYSSTTSTSANEAEGRSPEPASSQNKGKGKSEPYDMFFQDYGVNPSIDTEDDHLSTFGLDVDTGSYTVMRNYINDGYLPPSDSVRVEEYINYFEQGYKFPPAHQAFSISIDGAPSPFSETERYSMLRVGLQGYEVPDNERKDVSLTFVIDVSGSMDMDNRLGLVKRSLELLVERLGRGDQVSIVVYGSDARVILEPTPAYRKGQILEAIYRLQPEGVTNMEAGLRLGYKMALRGYNPDGINRVVLCSDGVANVGKIQAGQILREVRGYVEEGVMLTTIGFGMDNYNDTLMEQLADDGNGFYAYVDDIDEAQRLFVDDLTSTLQTIALDAKVQVDFNPDVVLRYRLVGYENRDVADEDFRNNEVDAGEIGAGHTVTALYEIKLNPRARGRIATVYLRWEDPDTREVVEMSEDFETYQMGDEFRDADPYFQWSVIVAEYAEILRDSYWAEDSSLEDVYRQAQWTSEYLYRDDDVREFVELVRKARRLADW